MAFKSILEESTLIELNDIAMKSNIVLSQIDKFLIDDFISTINKNYKLEIMNNNNYESNEYELVDVLIDTDYLLTESKSLLKLKIKENNEIKTLDFNVTKTENTNSENPKYYIFCDESNEIGFRFWFKKNL